MRGRPPAGLAWHCQTDINIRSFIDVDCYSAIQDSARRRATVTGAGPGPLPARATGVTVTVPAGLGPAAQALPPGSSGDSDSD